MRLSYSWLKDYVSIKESPEKLAELLTMAGLCVDSIHKKDGDSVMELEITSNRPDWLSYIGVAREIGAITGRKINSPYKTNAKDNKKTQSKAASVSVKIEDKKLCPRYTARVIYGVKVGESPKWLKEKIESIGLRSVNNIVDITNFCLFETGEPMHAFDIDKLAGRSIVVRRALKGEKIKTIDSLERSLDNDMLIIADEKSPIAIAGVMGGISSEVSSETKNILLEAAYFDQVSVRRTSRKLALSTDSSYRFERKVDIENIKRASDRAAQLILELAGGEAREFIDTNQLSSRTQKNIVLRFARLNEVIGINIAPPKVKNILISLGIKIKPLSKDSLRLTGPTFRYDLQNEIDVIEEIARIYGYGNIPETIPPVLESGKRVSLETEIDKDVRDTLSGLGLFEIITYSLLSKKMLSEAKLCDANTVSIKNPLSSEQEAMRPTLIVGMLNSIRWNINRKQKDLKLFELGRVYKKDSQNSFIEKKHIAIGITGQSYDGWISHSRNITFFDLKGVVEKLFSRMGVKQFYVKENNNGLFLQSACAAIEINGVNVGIMGQVDMKILHAFDIKEPVYVAEIDYEMLLKHLSREKRFRESPKFPSVIRDISIIVDKNISNGNIISLVKETAGAILNSIELVDRYSGGQIPEGKLGLTYRVEYLDPSRTLQDSDVNSVHSRIVNSLESALGAKLR